MKTLAAFILIVVAMASCTGDPTEIKLTYSTSGIEHHLSPRETMIEGEIINLSKDSIPDLRANLDLYDGKGVFVTSAPVILEFTHLMPGQRSKFRASTSYNPAIGSYDLTFITSYGMPIKAEFARK